MSISSCGCLRKRRPHIFHRLDHFQARSHLGVQSRLAMSEAGQYARVSTFRLFVSHAYLCVDGTRHPSCSGRTEI